MAVKGRSATSKECIVQFEGGAASDKRKVTLAKAEYGKRWVFLKEDEASPTIALPGPAYKLTAACRARGAAPRRGAFLI